VAADEAAAAGDDREGAGGTHATRSRFRTLTFE
jgi:hypothetical protein